MNTLTLPEVIWKRYIVSYLDRNDFIKLLENCPNPEYFHSSILSFVIYSSEYERFDNFIITNFIVDTIYFDLNQVKYKYMLKKLDCSLLGINEIPTIFPNLQELNCSYNKIEKIPRLSKLKILNCSYNKIKEIPKLPNLQVLNCSFNSINEVSEYLLNLTHLTCTNIDLTSIPKKYHGIKYFKRYKYPIYLS